MMRSDGFSVRRLALRLLGVGLVWMHGQLLWRRLADGSLTESGVAARWLASALLVVGFAVVYRRHGRLFRGRQAAVLWALVVLLHAFSGVPAGAMLAEPVPWLIAPIALIAARALVLALAPQSPPVSSEALRRARSAARLALPLVPAGALGSRAPPA